MFDHNLKKCKLNYYFVILFDIDLTLILKYNSNNYLLLMCFLPKYFHNLKKYKSNLHLLRFDIVLMLISKLKANILNQLLMLGSMFVHNLNKYKLNYHHLMLFGIVQMLILKQTTNIVLLLFVTMFVHNRMKYKYIHFVQLQFDIGLMMIMILIKKNIMNPNLEYLPNFLQKLNYLNLLFG